MLFIRVVYDASFRQQMIEQILIVLYVLFVCIVFTYSLCNGYMNSGRPEVLVGQP
jgi:hypothetical protein